MKKAIPTILICVMVLSACAKTTPATTPVNTPAATQPASLRDTTPGSTPTIGPSATPTTVSIPVIPAFLGNAAPTPPSTTFQNKVYLRGNTYIFEYTDKDVTIQYLYLPQTGSLHDLHVKINDEAPFYPSNYGGPTFAVGDKEIPAWKASSTYTIKHSPPIVDESGLQITWTATSPRQTIVYDYHFSILGKTLRMDFSSTTPYISQFTFDRSEGTRGARIVSIPYLSTLNLLLFKTHFVSEYFDWTLTHSSGFEESNWRYSDRSVFYGQTVYYKTNTDQVRLPMKETAYITVSDTLNDVLPNIPNPKSPYRELLAGKVVLDMWGGESFGKDGYFINELKSMGLSDLLVIEHVWQKCGYDDCYPDFMPANPALGGDKGLRQLGQSVSADGYLFALHENYIDIYPDAPSWNPKLVALNPNGSMIQAWYNETTKMQSFHLSPSQVLTLASQIAPEMHEQYLTTAAYVDGFAAGNPFYWVDYNASTEGNSQVLNTFHIYAQLLAYERLVHAGPILSEGRLQIMYAGLADGVEGEYQSYDKGFDGPNVPPVVDFDLLKIHPLMVVHGMGYYERYFGKGNQEKLDGFTLDDLYNYTSTEIAFCHAGFIPTPDRLGLYYWSAQAQREVTYVLPIQKLCALASPIQILYNVDGKLAGVEQALIHNQAWQVFVSYDSGLKVYVNRDPSKNWEISPASTQGWVDYSALIDGVRTDYVGTVSRPIYVIPPNGWLAYTP